jgi:hypothetical protein
MKRQITRKEFLAGTTKTVVAASAGAVAMSVIPASGGQQSGRAGVIDPVVTPWPWPYRTLDVEDVRKRAHQAYYAGGCGYGAFHALVAALADAVGAPFTQIPSQMLYWGGGGGAGWGTLCGALNGAAAAISLVVDRANANAIIGELFGWYTVVPFPTDISNEYGRNHQFYLNRSDKDVKQTVAGSTLCHASVSTWCTEAGVKASAPERAERCARLTGDVAARSVEYLNTFYEGRFKAGFVPPKGVTECQSCHGSTIGNVQSGVKMDCQQCHRQQWDHLY